MNKGELNLPKYVSLLKNLRAVVFLNPKLPLPSNEVNWLKRKYKYRNVGISKSLLAAIKPEEKEVFSKKPFRIVESPMAEIDNFIRIISKSNAGIPEYIVESVIVSSCYVSPIVVLGRSSFQVLSQLAAWSLKSTAELPEMEVKRNLRIIGYAILDFHEKVTMQAYKALKEIAKKVKSGENAENFVGDMEELLKKRMETAQKDGEKRFWRLRQTGGEEERVVIAYLDVLPLISKILFQEESQELADFIARSTVNLSMALSLVPTFILQLKT